MKRSRLAPLLLTGCLTLGVQSVGAVLPTPAAASPVGDAKARATALRLKVDRLRLQAEQATEQYDAAYEQLGQVVSEHLTAQQALDAAVASADDSAATADRRVRALYISGGTSALYATVLQGSDISDVLTRLQSVRRVVAGDRTADTTAASTVASRTAAERRLAALAAQRTRLQGAVADRADLVRTLLAQADALLAQADARVVQLAEEQRRADEAAAAARAAQALAQAQASWSFVAGAAPPPTEAASLAIAEAMRHLGAPYLWGATGPGAFDCSGLTLTAYRAAGIALPRTSQEQWYAGPHVDLGDLQPGDLLFWASDLSNPATIHHVALYIGNGQMIAAPHAGTNVRIQPVYLDGYMGAVRPSAGLGPTAPAVGVTTATR